jgi:hypothetical protein
MLVLRGEWLKAIGFPIGANAFLSTDKCGDITLRRMGLTRPRRLRVASELAAPPSNPQDREDSGRSSFDVG